MSSLVQDLRYAVRTFKKSPGFAAIAVATLAFGIGASCAIYTVVHSVLLKPLPFRDSGRLVRVTSDLTGQGLSDAGVSYPELLAACCVPARRATRLDPMAALRTE